jgi:hypothetical protein
VSETSYLTTIDLNDVGQSTVVDRFATTAGESLSGREPQGMAIRGAAGERVLQERVGLGPVSGWRHRVVVAQVNAELSPHLLEAQRERHSL